MVVFFELINNTLVIIPKKSPYNLYVRAKFAIFLSGLNSKTSQIAGEIWSKCSLKIQE